MSYILDVMNGKIEPRPDRIALEKYVIENSYVTKYLSRIVKDNSLSVYRVLFHLSYFETGKSETITSWANLGSFIVSEQGNMLTPSNVKRRSTGLLENNCITVNRQRGGANEIIIHLPTEITACRELIEKEQSALLGEDKPDTADYYSDPERKLMVLDRDKRKCVYCLIDVSEDSYFLDHITPVSKGGTNMKFNLVTSCEGCNQRKQETDAIQFLQSNYRNQLINQSEYLKQKEYIESLLQQQSTEQTIS